jgi:hypothetical protein
VFLCAVNNALKASHLPANAILLRSKKNIPAFFATKRYEARKYQKRFSLMVIYTIFVKPF